MATITTEQAGRWDDPSTWTGGTIPTSADDVYLQHAVTLYNANTTTQVTVSANIIYISRYGALSVDRASVGPITLECNIVQFMTVLDDTRIINLDGVIFKGLRPTISAIASAYPDLYNPPDIRDNGDGEVIIADTGFMSATAMLRDIKPEGCGRAYAEKISNGVRYHTVVIKIKYTSLHILRALYRMAENPLQVLAITPSCAIKGWIESVTPDPSSVGAEYITVRVTITEGA